MEGHDVQTIFSRGIGPNTKTRSHLVRGVVWFVSGLALMAYLFSLSALMAHHWEAPRHWPGTSCRLSGAAAYSGVHPDGHELEEQISTLRREGVPEDRVAPLEQELRELRRFPPAVALIALLPVAIGAAYLAAGLSPRRRQMLP
jgi:hypothetical protein